MNRPETHEILRSWRRHADTYEPERAAPRRGIRARHRQVGRLLRDGADELSLAFNFALLHATSTPGRCARPSPRGSRAARGRLALLGRVEPRRTPLHDALVRRRRSRSHVARSSSCSRCAGHPSSTTGTSSRSRTATCHRAASSTVPSRAGTRAARRCRGAGRAAGASPGSHSRTRAETSRSSRPIPRRRCASPATLSGSAAAYPPLDGLVHRASGARGRVGLAAWCRAPRSPSTSATSDRAPGRRRHRRARDGSEEGRRARRVLPPARPRRGRDRRPRLSLRQRTRESRRPTRSLPRPGPRRVQRLRSWRRSSSTTCRRSTTTGRSPSTGSISRSGTGSSWCSSARPAAGRRRPCACSPGSRRSATERSRSATGSSTTSRRRSATSRWCSRTTRSIPT